MSRRPKYREFDLPQTWAEFKERVEDAGVRDGDRIFMIDVGPDAAAVRLEHDEAGVEITGVEDDRTRDRHGPVGGPATGKRKPKKQHFHNGARAPARQEGDGPD